MMDNEWLVNGNDEHTIRTFYGRPQHYILVDGQPKAVPLLVWARWLDSAGSERQIAAILIGEARVSTVFIGLDHNLLPEGPALIFETMVFGGDLNGEQERYATLEEAMRGHERMVARVKGEAKE